MLQEQGEIYTSLKFSNDGKWILLGTSGEIAYVIDSFEYKVVARLQGARLHLRYYMSLEI